VKIAKRETLKCITVAYSLPNINRTRTIAMGSTGFVSN